MAEIPPRSRPGIPRPSGVSVRRGTARPAEAEFRTAASSVDREIERSWYEPPVFVALMLLVKHGCDARRPIAIIAALAVP